MDLAKLSWRASAAALDRLASAMELIRPPVSLEALARLCAKGERFLWTAALLIHDDEAERTLKVDLQTTRLLYVSIEVNWYRLSGSGLP